MQSAKPLAETTLASRHTLSLWGAVLLLGLAGLLNGNMHEPPWFDETYSMALAQHPPLELLRLTLTDYHPPLYNLALHALSQIFGPSLFVYRAFSALGALALAALGAGPLRRIWGTWAGLGFAALVLALPATLVLAQESRSYTWATFFVTGCALYGYLAAHGRRARDWTLFGAFSLAAAYTHYYAVIAVLIIHMLVIGRSLADRWQRRRYLVVAATVAVLYLPWAIYIPQQFMLGYREGWINVIDLIVIAKALLKPFAFRFDTPAPPIPSLLGLLLLGGLVGYGVIQALRKPSAAGRLALWGAVGYGLTLMTAIAISYGVRPFLTPRYMFVVIGLLLLPAVYALTYRVPRGASLALYALLIGLAWPQLRLIQTAGFNGPLDQVATFLEPSIQPTDVFVHVSSHTLGPLKYYQPDHQHYLYAPQVVEPVRLEVFGPAAVIGPDSSAALSPNGRAWLIGCERLPECRLTGELLASGLWRPVGQQREFRTSYAYLAVSITLIERLDR